MKIVCEACQAKYSISDDKVRGKVFKIRCKKCSHVIVVKGTGDGADAAGEFSAAPLTGSSMDAVADGAAWHVVINGDQVGPLADSDVRTRMARGELSADSFIWKEGFSDWVKIASLGEFADMAAPAPSVPEPYGGSFGASNDLGVSFAGSAPEPATYVSPQSADPFAGLGGGGLAAAPSADPFANAAGGMPDLFSAPMGGADAPGGGSFGGFDGGAKPSNGAGSAALTGQRHENSVLFSLSNLESLAKPSAPVSSSAPRPGASPSPIGDGSGLIDIRAMAAVVTGGSSAPFSPFSSSPGGSDLPSFAAPQFSPIAPVMLPVAHSSGPSKGVVALLAVMGVLIVAATAVIWKVMMKPAAAPVVAALPEAAPTPPPVAAAVAPEPAVPPPSAAPPADEKLPPREDSKPVATAKPEKGGGRSSSGSKKSNKPDPTPAEKPVVAAAAPAEKPAPVKAEPEKRKPSDSIDDLLAAASGGTKKPAPAAKREDDEPAPKKEAAPVSDKQLNSQDIVKAMTPVVGKARDCYAQFKVPGLVDLKLVVAPSGKVSPNVTGKFAGTPSGDCVEGAAKNARFPASSGGTFTYPVALR